VRNIEKQQNPTGLKTAFAGITIISCLISYNPASAFTKVGSGELIVGATARVGHDSNIFGNSIGGGVDDSFFSITPELLFVKDDSRSTINGRIATDITRYGDRSDEDFENFNSSLDITLPTGQGSPLSGNIHFGFDSIKDTNLHINDRINSDTFSGSANLTYNVSSKTGLRGGFLYSDSQNGGGFSDTKTSLVTAGVQYNYSSKTGVFIDGRLRTTESDGTTSVDNRSKGFTIGLTGELSPKLEGSISAGYQSTDARGNIAGDPDSDSLIAFANLTWTPQEKTNLVLTLSSDMDVSPGDQSVETTSARIQINHDISRALSIFGGIEIRSLDFRGILPHRKDDVSEFNGGIHYSINPRFSAGAEVSFFDSSSNVALSDYDRQVYSVFASFSY
jgi:hypothetical protein